MKKYFILIIALTILLIPGFAPGKKTTDAGMSLPGLTEKSKIQENLSASSASVKIDVNFAKIPLYFISNRGQVNKNARFYAKASRYTLWLTKEGLVFDSVKQVEEGKQTTDDRRQGKGKFARDVSRLIFLDANRNPKLVPVEKTKLKVNYFKGSDKSKWHCDIPTSGAVLYKSLYKNIDLKVYGLEKQIEYDWMVKPGGKTGDIRFEYKDVKGTRLNAEGNLLIETEFGELLHKRPYSYQYIDKKRITVRTGFKRIAKNTYGFEVGEYDKNRELIIDPMVLVYSTYLGGDGYDVSWSTAVDASGYVYVAGETLAADFPILDQYQAYGGGFDVFVTKLDTTRTGTASLLYSTYLGGESDDSAYGIAVDAEGMAYITGRTYGTDFPCLDQYMTDTGDSDYDAFVTKLDTTQPGAAGLIYSTYLGGNGEDWAYAIAVDTNGYAYVTGRTSSTDYPCLNQYQADMPSFDVFVTKLDTTQAGASGLLYSTYLGGEWWDVGRGIAVDANQNVYVTGDTESTDFPTLNQYMSDPGNGSNRDVFVTKIDTTQEGASSLLYSTYLGEYNGDRGNGIAVDAAGIAYVTGYTGGSGFPILNQYQAYQNSADAFVTKLDTTKSGTPSLIYSTYLGGEDWDEGSGISIDAGGNVYVTGFTKSTDFPILNQYMSDPGDVNADVFVTKIDTTQAGAPGLIYSTYLGGNGEDKGYGIARDSSGNVYVTGYTGSTDFPTLNQYMTDPGDSDWDAFITKLTYAVIPTVTTATVSAITTTTASGGGEVTSDGGSPVTARGVCWSTSENPTTDDSHTTDGSGAGVFTSSMTGLTPNTVYNVRAYAVSAAGTAYGNEETVETLDPSITVTSPNGGETWVVGAGHTITWTSDGVEGNVKIEYSTNNGGDWVEITASTENDGSHPWTVPSVLSYLCLIRVSESGGSPADTSDSVFTIAVSASAIPLSEREALIALYNNTRGFQWLNNTNWKKTDGNFNDPGTEYTWYGITVENNHVTVINLPDNELEDGTLPAEIGNLSHLTKLNLKQGYVPANDPLSGPIPASLGNLGQLSYLDLSGHDFSGDIPAEFWNLTNLEYLDLDDNELTGGIPASLGDIQNLGTLSIRSNGLSGSIPDSLTNLGNLTYLSLGSNDFDGDIPPGIGSLTGLAYIDLSNNSLTGGIPSGMGDLAALNTLRLNGNKLMGSLPTGLTHLTGLTFTDIGYNALYTGDEPLIAFLNGKDPDWESTQTVAPTDVSLAVPSSGSFEVTWTPILFSTGDGGYTVFYSTTPGGPYTRFDTTADKTVPGMTVTGLIPDTTYFMVVQTRTLPGINKNTVDSEYSNEVSADTYSSITVTSPRGGENWDVGSVYDITWTSEGTVGNVRIEYSTNGGNSWGIIAPSTENDGSYNWRVPATPSDHCLVRVSETDEDGGPSDVSDAVFSIVSPVSGAITLRSPNGGESWVAGSSRQIQWNSTGDINQVAIKYSTDSGTTWKSIAQTTSNDGSYNWVVPDVVSDQCLVRVSAKDSDLDPKPADISDAVFSILLPSSPSLRVIAPNGGEQLAVGSMFTITWSATNTREDVRIEYSVNGGDTWREITAAADNNGKYDWIVPGEPSDNCLVRISGTSGQPMDVSDAVFSIVSPSPGELTVTSPNGGENWVAGSSREITWTSTGDINHVTLEYSKDNGTTWNTIVQTTPNNGSFNWTLPNIASDECLVRIGSKDEFSDPRPADVSEAVFSIVPPASPTITVIAPNGGEQWVKGSSVNITWHAVSSREEVKIEYSVDGGQNWIIIAGAAENNGDYEWIVPGESSETCLVRISETDGQPVDISDAVFSILQPLPGDITVTAPNGGESWTGGSSQEITWTGSGDINHVTIEGSADNGTTWNVIAQTTANDGSYAWTIPDAVSAECLVRVSSNDSDPDPRPSDVSDDVFSIVPGLAGELRVTSPNGGESWEVGTTQAITWTHSGDLNSVMIEYSDDNGNTWNTLVSSVSNSGTYDWQVPDTAAAECLVRVTANDGDEDPNPTDVSDATFAIVLPASPTLRVITPNGGEQLVIGSAYEITWFGTNSREPVKIEYSGNGGQTWTEITGSTENDGDYDWTVPGEPSEICLVRISEIDGQPVDVSDAVFSIVQPQTGDLTVLTPNGGENLETGSEYNITWTGSGLNNIIIEYSVNNGATWLYIAKVPADNGSYTWTVPGTPGELCLVRISGAEADENPSDVSDGVFTISDPSQASIEVFTPNGGESLSVGQEYYITWGSSGINNVLIEYSTNNGDEWIPIDTVSAIGGRFTWTVPGAPSESCLLRISGTDSAEAPSDVSDAVFSITAN